MAVVSLALLAALFHTSASAQDWLTWRHDYGRSARADVEGDLATPTLLWSLPLGRSATPPPTLSGDYDGDGVSELYYLSAGRVIASQFGTPVVWQSEWIGIDQLAGAWDFDGDGRREILGARRSSPSGLALVDLADGRVRWQLPSLGEGTRELRLRENLQLADLTGDGRPEIIVNPISPSPEVSVFSFDPAVTTDGDGRLWTTPLPGATLVSQIVVAERDGEQLLVVATPSEINLLDSASGEILEQIPPPPGFIQPTGLFRVVDTDDDGDDEIVCVSVSSTAYGAALFDLASESVRWSIAWPAAGHALVASPESVADFDGDGELEIALSVYGSAADELDADGVLDDHDGVSAPTSWTLLTLDARTGAVESAHEDWLFLTSLRDGRADALVARDVSLELAGAGLSPWDSGRFSAFRADGEGALGPVGDPLSLRAVSTAPRFDASRSTYVRMSSPVGDAAYLVGRFDGSTVLSAVRLGAAGLARAEELGTVDRFSFSAVIDPRWRASGVERALIWDSTLGFTRAGIEGTVPGPGFRSEALVARNDAGPYVLAPRSGGELAIVALPDTVVEGPLESDDAVAMGGGDVRGLVVADLRPRSPGLELFWSQVFGSDTLRLNWMESDGTATWREEILDGASVRSVTAGPFGTAGATAVVLAVTDLSRPLDESVRLWRLDGSGAAAVDVGVARPTRLLGHIVPGPEVDEAPTIAVPVTTELSLRRASDGVEVGTFDTGWESFVVSADTDGDGVVDLIVDDTTELRLIDGATLEQRWMAPKAFAEEGTGIPLGTARRGPAANLDVVQATAAGHLRLYDSDSGARVWAVQLGDGAVFAPRAAQSPSISAPVAADVDGDGVDEVIVGSADGFLYAIDARDGSLDWALSLNSPVGAPSVALDGAGELVILVATSDGFLRGVGQATLAAPAEVREVASRAGEPFEVEVDIDVWDRRDHLSVAWDDVDAASSYEVRLVSETDAVVADWRSTGDTAIHFDSLGLIEGRTYFAQVRALSARSDGTVLASEVVAGDGVLLADVRPADEGGLSDAGFDGGFDAGFDAGVPDVTFDAGVPDVTFDAGVPDVAFDAGVPDGTFDLDASVGSDLGFDAGRDVAADSLDEPTIDLSFDVRLDTAGGGTGDARTGLEVDRDDDGCACTALPSKPAPSLAIWGLAASLVLLRRRAIRRRDA